MTLTMEADPLARGRATIEESLEGLRVEIPARRHWPTLAVLGVWLVIWAVSEVAAVATLLGYGSFVEFETDATSWLAFWTITGAWALFLFSWGIAGREEVEVSAGRLVVAKRLGALRRAKSFDASRVEDLRLDAEQAVRWDLRRSLRRALGLGVGVVAFDYGTRTHRFGLALDEPEAEQLLPRIREALR